MHTFEQLAKRWLVGALLVLGVVLLTVLAGGVLLPERHEITRTLTLSRSPDAVWRAITDSGRIRAWRNTLMKLEHLPDSAGRARWREIANDGTGTVVTVLEEQPPVHWRVLRQAERRGPVLEWDCVLERAPSGVALRVTQRGRVPGRAQRFLAQFSSGHAAELERYLLQLADYFEEPARLR
jgi:uncharacterized protein YndB with AHSA1/START domain